MKPQHGLSFSFLLFLFASRSAYSCGGFFCSQSQPVNQAAEEIIFIHDGTNNQVTAVVEIQYEGPSERFGWLLPVPGIPEVSVSSKEALANLKAATNPQYNVQTTVEGECKEPVFMAEADGDGTTVASAPNPEFDDNSGGAVKVEETGSVGPYDYVVISVNLTITNDPAKTAVDWLTANGYDVMPNGPEVLRSYLQDGMNLLAFRLTKGTDAGSIRPVILKYDSKLPMIPIRPTAVAANDNMGILVYVVGETRAVPDAGYKSLVLNEALINWFNPNSNYNDVVIAAATQAGGQGFVTELADQSKNYDNVIFTEEAQKSWTDFPSTTDAKKALQEAWELYGDWDGFREAIDASVTFPSGDSVDDFIDALGDGDGIKVEVEVDTTKLKNQLNIHVIQPINVTENLILSQRYLTRLYTTMSAGDMNKDPVFNFDANLPDYDNVHTANQTIFCNESFYRWEAPWKMILPANGDVVEGQGSGSPWPFAIADMPASVLEYALSDDGGPDLVTNNTAEIKRALDNKELDIVVPRDDIPTDDTSGATTTTHVAMRDGWMLLLGLGLSLVLVGQ